MSGAKGHLPCAFAKSRYKNHSSGYCYLTRLRSEKTRSSASTLEIPELSTDDFHGQRVDIRVVYLFDTLIWDRKMLHTPTVLQ